MPPRAAANLLTRPQLLALLKHAGKAPMGVSKMTVGELSALCKRFRLIGSGELLQLDDAMLRIILHKKAQQVGGDPSILFMLEEVCKTFRDILRDPAEASIWEEAWESYKASNAAAGDGIDDPGGTARQRCLLLTVRGCTVCRKTRVQRAPTWTFLQRCCYDCLKEITISAYTLEHRYGVPADKLEGLPHYAKDMRTDWSGDFTAQFYSRDDIKPILREMYGTDSWDAVAEIIEERLAQEAMFPGVPHFAVGPGEPLHFAIGGPQGNIQAAWDDAQHQMQQILAQQAAAAAAAAQAGQLADEGEGPDLAGALQLQQEPQQLAHPQPQQPADPRSAAAAAALRRQQQQQQAGGTAAAAAAGGAATAGTDAALAGGEDGTGPSGLHAGGASQVAAPDEDEEHDQLQAAMAASRHSFAAEQAGQQGVKREAEQQEPGGEASGGAARTPSKRQRTGGSGALAAQHLPWSYPSLAPASEALASPAAAAADGGDGDDVIDLT